MFEKPSDFTKAEPADQAKGWVPPRSPWEPLNPMGLAVVAVVALVLVAVVILLTRAFLA